MASGAKSGACPVEEEGAVEAPPEGRADEEESGARRSVEAPLEESPGARPVEEEGAVEAPLEGRAVEEEGAVEAPPEGRADEEESGARRSVEGPLEESPGKAGRFNLEAVANSPEAIDRRHSARSNHCRNLCGSGQDWRACCP